MTVSINQEELLRSFLPKEASKHDQETFIHICKRTGLDPTLRQIYPVKRYDKESGRWVITNQTSIDGYRLIAERTGKYAPGKEPVYTYDKDGRLFSCTAYVKKQTVDGTWHEVGAIAFWSEYAQYKKDGGLTQFWAKMGHLMLAKCAEALALRKAFPDMYSKLYTDDEMSNSITIEQEEISEIELPDDVSQTEMDAFLEDYAKQYKTTPDKLKKRAMENPDPFWKLFNNWKEKQNQMLLTA